MGESVTFEERGAGRRGVLASYEPVTPSRTDDASKFKLTVRDVLLLLAGCVAMYGAQLATQYGMRSDIRDLGTKFENFQMKQGEVNESLRREIDEWRRETKLARVENAETARALSELRGILIGSGIKNVDKMTK